MQVITTGTRSIKFTQGMVVMAFAMTAALTGCGGGSGDSAVTATPTVTATVPTSTSTTFTVRDTAGTAMLGATVYAIPATDVAAIATQPITLTNGMYSADAQKVDEPLEDLINGNYTPTGGGVATYKLAVADSGGNAVITDLPASASYFVYVKPASTDTEHLPGGSLARTALAGTALVGKTTAIKVSTMPSAAATYIGSSLCILCHRTYETEKRTLHKLGIMAPKSPSGLQDVSQFSSTTNADENLYSGLSKFESGTTVYYYNFANNKFKTLTTEPTAAQIGSGQPVYFTLQLSKNATTYQVKFTNVITPTDPNSGMVKDVALTYGGGLYKQRYVTKLGSSLYVIPLQFNSQGSDASTDSGRTQFVEYNTVSSKWWDATNKVFLMPEVVGKSTSFDIKCAGCHYTGYSVSKNSSGEYLATGVPDYQGETNPGTGTTQELNIGCESCHGPGSEHLNAGGEGKFIVTPTNITPEREIAICAQCHTRSQANDMDALRMEAPLDLNNKMPAPGISRAQYLASNVARHDAVPADLWADGKHSKKHHQQATDFIQTKKYRNGTQLTTCASCHDVHAPGTDRHQLSGTSDNTLCISCHATTGDIATHMTAKTGFNMGPSTLCIQCHVQKTAKSGSGSPTTLFTGASGVKYFTNDISSHRFDVPLRSSVSATNTMPIAFTNECGVCHNPGRLP